MLKRVVRRELLKNVETKRNIVLNENYTRIIGTGFNSQYAYTNIFANLSVTGQGAAQNQYEGTEILDPLFVARISFDVHWGVMQAAGTTGSYAGMVPVFLHAWVIAVNDQLTANVPTVTPAEWFTSALAASVQMNGNNVRVIKHWSRMVNPPSIPFSVGSPPTAATGTTCVRHKMVCKMKGKKEFEENASLVPQPYLRGWNYYFVQGYGFPKGFLPSGTTYSAAVDCWADRYLYFKDP